MFNNEHVLVGKTVIKAYINKGRTEILLVCENDESFLLQTQGDCCSESWIEHSSGFNELPFTIMKVEEKELGEVLPTRQEYDQLYSLNLEVKRSTGIWYHKDCGIEFRNSSNGYYGGYLEVYPNPKVDMETFTELKEDF